MLNKFVQMQAAKVCDKDDVHGRLLYRVWHSQVKISTHSPGV